MNKARFAIIVTALLGISISAYADDQSPDDSMASAYAKLQARQAAATQPAIITTGELASLRAELAQLRAQVAQLTASNAEMKKQLAEPEKPTTRAVAPAIPAATPAVNNPAQYPSSPTAHNNPI